jgi:hypothetical protein
MKMLQSRMFLGVLAAVLCLGGNSLSVQAQDRPQGGRGNFDPEQFKQRMMDRYREQLEVKDDEEWKLISTRVEKVLDARREVGTGGMGMGMGFAGGRGGRRGGGADGGGDAARPAPAGDDQGGRPRGGGGPRGFGETGPEIEALQQAIESKASAEDLKAKMAKVREVRKAKEAKLEKAQEELRALLSARQEAAALLGGLLK